MSIQKYAVRPIKSLMLMMAVMVPLQTLGASQSGGEVAVPDALRERIVARYDAWKAMDLKTLYGFLSETKRKSVTYESFILKYRPKMELAGYEILDLKCATEESCSADLKLSLKRLPVKGGGAGPVDIVKPEKWIRESGQWYVYQK